MSTETKSPVITCPKCGESFPLDETLAGPMIARIREEADEKVLKASREADERAKQLLAREQELSETEKF